MKKLRTVLIVLAALLTLCGSALAVDYVYRSTGMDTPFENGIDRIYFYDAEPGSTQPPVLTPLVKTGTEGETAWASATLLPGDTLLISSQADWDAFVDYVNSYGATMEGYTWKVTAETITIQSQDSWDAFAAYVNAGYVTAGCKWVLTANVSVNSENNNSINRVFYGTLAGGSSDPLCKIEVSDHAVFETLGTGAVVENLNFDGAIQATVGENGSLGCVANVVDGGTIRNCTINGASISVTAGSGSRIGSFVGLLQSGSIENCTFDGSVNFNVSGEVQNVSVGGIVGESEGTVSGCSNHMSISVSGLGSDCYVGAMVGKATGGSVVDCAFSGSIVTESTGDTAPKVGCVAGTAAENVRIRNCTNSSNVGWEVGTDEGKQVITINKPEQTTFTYSAGSIKVGTQEDADIRYTIASGYTGAVTVKWYRKDGQNYIYTEKGAVDVGTYYFVIESSAGKVLFRLQDDYEITPLVITDDMLDIKLGNMSLNPGEGNTVTYNGLERTLYYTHNGKAMTFDPFLTGDLTLLLDGTGKETTGDRLQTTADYGQDISSRVVGKDAGTHTITFRASANVDASKLQRRTFEIQPKALSSGMLRYEPSSITYGDPIPALQFADNDTGLAFTLPGDNSTLNVGDYSAGLYVDGGKVYWKSATASEYTVLSDVGTEGAAALASLSKNYCSEQVDDQPVPILAALAVTPRNVSNQLVIEFPENVTYPYTGSAITPAPAATEGAMDGFKLYRKVNESTKEWIDPQNYSFTYSNNVNAGTATVSVAVESGNYSGSSATGTFTISSVSIAPPKNEGEPEPVKVTGVVNGPLTAVYSGSAYSFPADFSLKYGDIVLVQGTDYTVSFSRVEAGGGETVLGSDFNTVKDVGKYRILLSGRGNYSGQRVLALEITPYMITGDEQGLLTASLSRQIVYVGDRVPAITVTFGGENVDFTVAMIMLIKGMEGIEVDGEQGLNTVGDYQIRILLKNYKYVPSGASNPTSEIYLNLRVVNKIVIQPDQIENGTLPVEIKQTGAYEIPSVGSSVKSVTITTADGQSDGIRYMPGASIWLPAGNYEFRFNY